MAKASATAGRMVLENVGRCTINSGTGGREGTVVDDVGAGGTRGDASTTKLGLGHEGRYVVVDAGTRE